MLDEQGTRIELTKILGINVENASEKPLKLNRYEHYPTIRVFIGN